MEITATKEVVLSTTEAEYLALTETAREVEWVKNLITEIQEFIGSALGTVPTMVDNQSAMSLANDHTNSKRPKHRSLRNHFCRQQQEVGDINIHLLMLICRRQMPLIRHY